eukprot:29424-Pelagococcus_subviridis.AAC.1
MDPRPSDDAKRGAVRGQDGAAKKRSGQRSLRAVRRRRRASVRDAHRGALRGLHQSRPAHRRASKEDGRDGEPAVQRGLRGPGPKERGERGAGALQVRSIHWSPYDRVGVVNAPPLSIPNRDAFRPTATFERLNPPAFQPQRPDVHEQGRGGVPARAQATTRGVFPRAGEEVHGRALDADAADARRVRVRADAGPAAVRRDGGAGFRRAVSPVAVAVSSAADTRRVGLRRTRGGGCSRAAAGRRGGRGEERRRRGGGGEFRRRRRVRVREHRPRGRHRSNGSAGDRVLAGSARGALRRARSGLKERANDATRCGVLVRIWLRRSLQST